MAYTGETLPPNIDLQFVSGTGFSTDVVMTASGHEQRNQNWEADLARFIVRYNARRPAINDRFIAFFKGHLGRAHTFRFRDPAHYIATAAQGKVASGQMVLRYTFGSLTFDRPITKPDAAVVLSGTSGTPTFSTTTGLISGGTATGWTGPFWLCGRFESDRLEFDAQIRNPTHGFMGGFQDVPIVEVRGTASE